MGTLQIVANEMGWKRLNGWGDVQMNKQHPMERTHLGALHMRGPVRLYTEWLKPESEHLFG
jgi:hypothetical protein